MAVKENQPGEIFWCGAVLNHKGLQSYAGETPAATQWSRGLLEGLRENGVRVTGFAPMWDTLFPKGRLFPGHADCLDETIPQTLVPYINVPGLRTPSVAASLERKIVQRIKQGSRPMAILNYNPYPYYCRALTNVARRYPEIPWINIVLDLDDPIRDNWQAFKERTEQSRGNVYLSWWGYCHAPGDHKLHLDGGWDGTLPDSKTSAEKVFIYAGKFAEYGGINEVIDAIRLFPERDVFFDFYGKGQYDRLTQLAASDNRVRLRGFVPDAELAEACASAIAFLNPRDLHFHGTRMIFPSKLLFYLKFLKPIIGPMMPGLSPDYEPMLVQPDGTTPQAWSAAMEKVYHLSPEQSRSLTNQSLELLKKKTWKNQAGQLHKFISAL